MEDAEYFLDYQWFNCRSDQTEPTAISNDENGVNTEENVKDQGYIR